MCYDHFISNHDHTWIYFLVFKYDAKISIVSVNECGIIILTPCINTIMFSVVKLQLVKILQKKMKKLKLLVFIFKWERLRYIIMFNLNFGRILSILNFIVWCMGFVCHLRWFVCICFIEINQQSSNA